MTEGQRTGRLVVWPDPAVGAAAWLLPKEPSAGKGEAAAKADFLAQRLGPAGQDAYRRMLEFMQPRAATIIGETAWFLSILGAHPTAQGHSIGQRLLEPTLAEADFAGAECYLETFSEQTPNFYRRWRCGPMRNP